MDYLEGADLKPTPLPTLIVHADWGSSPVKRWLARAILQDNGVYTAFPPEPVGDLRTLLSRLSAAGKRCSLVGFDFPIGLPRRYALQAGVEDFLALLPQLGREAWRDFYRVAEQPEQINLRRPFYPQRPGSARLSHLLDGLGIESVHALRRRCEAGRPGRRAASPLFWTMGGQQVGKAAISGWLEVLGPGLAQAQDLSLAIWPFSGRIDELFEGQRLVIVESYPAEYYTHLGIAFSSRLAGGRSGKRVQVDRAANASTLLAWAERAPVSLTTELQQSLRDGFGSNLDGEDRFDAAVGLFGMLNGILGYQPIEEPEDPDIRRIEGWIFGQKVCNRN